MNKLMNAFLLTLLPIVAFAQERMRPAREGQFPSDNGMPSPEEMSVDAPTDGGEWAPIDDYTFFLIGVAVLIIAYVMYRRNQLSKA